MRQTHRMLVAVDVIMIEDPYIAKWVLPKC